MFDRTNYDIWKTKMKMHLKETYEEAWKITLEGTTFPLAATTKAKNNEMHLESFA